MEMVAASKMRKAQERMRAARPYGEKIRNVAAHICARQPGVPPSVPGRARHGQARRHHRRHDRQGPVRRAQHQRAAPGAGHSTRSGRRRASRSKSARSATRAWASCSASARTSSRTRSQLGDRPQMDKLIGAVKVMLDGYIDGPLRPADDLLHALHQHDEAGAGDASSCCRCRGEQLGAPRRRVRGTTSTSPTRTRCSTRC